MYIWTLIENKHCKKKKTKKKIKINPSQNSNRLGILNPRIVF